MKKVILIVVAAVLIVLVGAGAMWGKKYYEEHYVGTDYYTMVPMNYDITPEMQYSQSGKEVGLGKLYELTAYSPEGEAKEIWFYVRGDDSSEYPQPGAFLCVKASKYLVNGWGICDKGSVPDKALAQLS